MVVYGKVTNLSHRTCCHVSHMYLLHTDCTQIVHVDCSVITGCSVTTSWGMYSCHSYMHGNDNGNDQSGCYHACCVRHSALLACVLGCEVHSCANACVRGYTCLCKLCLQDLLQNESGCMLATAYLVCENWGSYHVVRRTDMRANWQETLNPDDAEHLDMGSF